MTLPGFTSDPVPDLEGMDAAFGPLDDDLTTAQREVEQAEKALEAARDHRARTMIHAHTQGYSVYALGRLTGRRKAPSVHRDLRRFTHTTPEETRRNT